MTQIQMERAVRRQVKQLEETARDMTPEILARWIRRLSDDDSKELRAKARAATGHYFVRSYTVKASMRRLPQRRS